MSFFSKASHFGSRSYKKLPISSYNTKKIGSFANLDYEISNNRTTLVKKLKEIPKKLIMNKTQKDEKNAFFNQEKKLKEKIDCPITQINSKDENTEIPKIFNSKLQVNLPKNRSTTIHYLTPPNKFKSKEKK